MGLHQNEKNLMLQKTTSKKWKAEWENIFANHVSDKDLYTEYMKKSYNSTETETTQF